MKGGLRSEGGSRGGRWGQKGLLGCRNCLERFGDKNLLFAD